MKPPPLAIHKTSLVINTKKRPSLLRHPFFIRLLHWEYWPANVVYAPIIFYWLWLCAKCRSMYFFSASNPGIPYGGMTMESKFDIYNMMPKQYQPTTILIEPGKSISQIVALITQAGLAYPVYAKPDVGGKGIAVKKIDNEDELITYLPLFNVKMLVQQTIDYKQEAGIFYYRYPGDAAGHISGIVLKDYLSVTGDGVSTIYELLQQNSRYILQIPALRQAMGVQMVTVLPAGEQRILVPVGNHARGSKFIDATPQITDALEKTIDDVCRQIPGFYFGRLDVKFDNIAGLQRGENFSIIELNGAGSEPTHIYDPAHSIFFAWREIIRHWKIIYTISRRNHKLGVPYMTNKEGRKMRQLETAYFTYVNSVLQKAGAN